MVQRKIKRARTQKSDEPELMELMTQLARIGSLLAKRGFSFLEGLISEKRLHEVHPYLPEAVSNVKGAFGILQHGLNMLGLKGAPANEGRKAKKGHKKI